MSLIDTNSKSTVVYDELQLYSHNHTNHFNLIQKTDQSDSLSPSSTDAE